MLAIIVAPFLLYALLLIGVLVFSNRKKHNSTGEKLQQYFSIVIPFRNEKENLTNLIQSIKHLEFDKGRFEILFIDDHSLDSGKDLITHEMENSGLNWRIISLRDEEGKKSAIKLGVKEAEYEFITLTDADCVLPVNWLSSIQNSILSENLDLILGPIKYNDNQTGVFAYLQRIELAALMSLTNLSCKIGRPILGNAANMSFRKSLFKDEYLLESKSESGDDLFLLYALKKLKVVNIGFNEGAVVTTNASSGINHFVAQRIRWASKSKYIKDWDTIVYGFFNLALNIIQIVLFIALFFDGSYLLSFMSIFLIKFFCDTTLVLINQKVSSVQLPIFGSLLLSFIYPFYSILIVSFSLFLKPQWKGRRI